MENNEKNYWKDKYAPKYVTDQKYLKDTYQGKQKTKEYYQKTYGKNSSEQTPPRTRKKGIPDILQIAILIVIFSLMVYFTHI